MATDRSNTAVVQGDAGMHQHKQGIYVYTRACVCVSVGNNVEQFVFSSVQRVHLCNVQKV